MRLDHLLSMEKNGFGINCLVLRGLVINLSKNQILDCGALAQLGERLLCTQEVSGSIPLGSIGERSPRMNIEN